jgi:hypothetical protein
MTALRLAAAACLVPLALLVALLAADVRSWRTALESGDAVYAASPSHASWTPSTRLGGLGEELLGVRDDVALRRALQRFHQTVGLRLRLDNALEVQTARARAQDALEGAALDSDPQRASQAQTLLGILAFAASSRGGDQSQVDAAASDFTDAIRADPADDPAKFDLELVLRLTATRGVRPGPGLGGGYGPTGRHGAGRGLPGKGY